MVLAREGLALLEVIFDDAGRPVDHRILAANAAFGKQSGIKDPVGRTARELAPNLEQSWNELYGAVVATACPRTRNRGPRPSTAGSRSA